MSWQTAYKTYLGGWVIPLKIHCPLFSKVPLLNKDLNFQQWWIECPVCGFKTDISFSWYALSKWWNKCGTLAE